MSPSSMKITFEQLKRGKSLDFKECLKMEYRIVLHIMKEHDFYEGVRAVLVDKDNKPRWKPATLAETSEKQIQKYFEKLPDRDELQL
ncbi:unnamed protein product [Didymodactylos carnosus]|nr:unnamed protein product [Didymodactylos carnosus]CAF4405635.1 unnamed protein product [Didymodactylos carnosus]